MKKQTLLVILDGFGIAEDYKGNAICLSKKPNLDYLFDNYPFATLNASMQYVGLLDGQMGNSEVGHLNIGSGRVVKQDLTLINDTIQKGSFFKNTVLKNAIERTKAHNSTLHLIGLCSDGGVHSDISHLFALLEMCKQNNLKNVNIHFISDGRDTKIDSGIDFATLLQNKINELGVGKISSLSGRFFAMDRENNIDRTQKYYDLLSGKIVNRQKNIQSAFKNSYKNKVYDEFIAPVVIGEKSCVEDNDCVLFFDFRADRMRQIVDKFLTEIKNHKFNNLGIYSFTNYSDKFDEVKVVFPTMTITNTLSEIVSVNKMTQYKISETTKYAHVTYFLNGGVEKPFEGEERKIVNGGVTEHFEDNPIMKSEQITDNLLKAINSDKFDLLVVNYPNCDMVGHTGSLGATILAVEQLDKCIEKLYKKILEKDAVMIICADHGNAEKMINEDGSVCTTHTTNKVPFCIVNYKDVKLKKDGSLCNIAPTILDIMKIDCPKEFTAKSLIQK